MSRPAPGTVVASLVALSVLGGCASAQKQLEHVAKDWCLTIRASQVLPVYPLTEDLQPGDVFLVTVPVQKQVDIYRERGFLPLDLMVTRLQGLDYSGLYADGYWKDHFGTIPHARMVRAEGSDTSGTNPDGNTNDAAPFDVSGDFGAPLAAFPTYTFSVKKKAGARLAIPVQGVPIALGFMSASSAVGSVTISDVYTYAAPTEDLIRKLRIWAGEPETNLMLTQLVQMNPKTPLYLRVVQRVYMTGGVVVSVTNSKAKGGGGSADLLHAGRDLAGIPGAENLTAGSAAGNEGNGGNSTASAGTPAAPPTDTNNGEDGGTEQKPAPSGGVPGATDLESVNKALSDALSDKSPGASLSILQASSRSVSMKENFDRPLVIGYIGFDFPIEKDGQLGVPIATLSQLEEREGEVRRPLLGNEQSLAEGKIASVLDAYIELERGDPEQVAQAKEFVIKAAKLIDDPGVKEVGTKVEKEEIPAGASVLALRSAINKYLARKEPEGDGGVHDAVMAALEAAKGGVKPMATKPIDATEIETTDLTREQLGAYIRKELQSGSTKSVEVYKKGRKEFTRTWVIGFEYSDHNIVKL